MKKLCVWITAAALCLGLASCGGGTPPETPDRSPTGGEEPAPETESGVTEEALRPLFEAATGYQGTSGSSLRAAQAAYNFLAFAERVDYARASLIDRAEAVAGVYSGMDDEQRGEFVENFNDLRYLMADAFRDFASVRGVFDDAGVGEEMDALLEADDAQEQWDALSSDIPSPVG